MSRRAALVLATLLLAPSPARSALAPADLDRVGAAPAPGAALPADPVFTDTAGRSLHLGEVLGQRPIVLILADYRCREICGPILAVAAGALGGTGLEVGRDYDLLVIGLNPRATFADAARMATAQLGALAGQARLLSGPPDAIAAVEAALNYRVAYDAEADRYAHPADAVVLTRAGAVSRVLPGLSLDPATLRLALVEAGDGRIGSFADRLRVLCYGLDPAHGVANRAVGVVLALGGALTLAGLGGFVLLLGRRAPAVRGNRDARA